MNERIRELWEEATVSTWPRPGKFTAGEYDYHLEKFAEMIVRECAEQIKTQGISASSEGYGDYEIGFNAGLFHALHTTKQHFGVKE